MNCTRTWFPQGQESQEKMEGFDIKSGKFTKFKKFQILSAKIYKVPYLQKPSNGKKLFKTL